MKIQYFTDLRIWQESYQLSLDIYKTTQSFPKVETYGISDQMRRASSSIGANIAEGFGRFHLKEKVQFMFHSRGSLYELMHFILLARGLGYIDEIKLEELNLMTKKLLLGLNAYISSLKKKL